MSFKGHTETIRSVAFSPDDKTLLSGSGDRTARLWDVVTGQEVLTLKEHKFPVHLVAFAPDGKRLATASHNEVKLWLAATEPEATAFRWELDPDDPDSPRTANDWGDRLQEIHRPQEAENAYRKALARLEKLAAALPDTPDYQDELAYCLVAPSLMTDPPPAASQSHHQFVEIWPTLPADRRLRLGWRLHQLGHTHEQSGQPEMAIAAYSRSIELAPEKLEWHIRRGSAYAQMNEWPKAAEDFEVGRQLANPEAWYLYAMLRLQLGQNENYQKACTELLERYLKTAKIDSTNLLAWTCVLAPEAVPNMAEVVALAEKLAANDPKSVFCARTLGAAYLRTGKIEEAIKELTRADGLQQLPTTWLLLSLAHRRLGKIDEARQWLDKAVQWIDRAGKAAPDAADSWDRLPWSDRVLLGLLRREAEME